MKGKSRQLARAVGRKRLKTFSILATTKWRLHSVKLQTHSSNSITSKQSTIEVRKKTTSVWNTSRMTIPLLPFHRRTQQSTRLVTGMARWWGLSWSAGLSPIAIPGTKKATLRARRRARLRLERRTFRHATIKRRSKPISIRSETARRTLRSENLFNKNRKSWSTSLTSCIWDMPRRQRFS